MSKSPIPADRNGSPLAIGDSVIFKHASEGLLRGLPSGDQLAIRNQEGNALEIIGFNDQGNPELEFVDESGVRHSIWVENSNIEKVN